VKPPTSISALPMPTTPSRTIAAARPGTTPIRASGAPNYGIGPLTAVAFLPELGDATRFPSSRKAVRYAGLDITVSQSDSKRAPGRLSLQGPATLRWAAFEAATSPARPTVTTTRRPPTGPAATAPALALARKLVQRAYHTLRELGEEALQPA
jgi:transposase